ncbi:MAG: Holliday junction branch migration protein RuvA [Candidatus Izemoplasmataceae bacterium]|uniref:Holliday junction branch migration protein RuvA n=1 Tax=Liberiplasma polymorphum TaxID=3374570 RepID=UPI003774549D
MYSYLKGTIVEIEPTNITLDNQGIGFQIVTPNPYDFKVQTEQKVFIFQYVREDELTLFGFKSIKEKQLFMQLLSVKGIGPKSALAVLASGNVEEIVKAIETSDAKYLNRFPGIGPKASQQIILDLKGKINLGPLTLSKSNRLSEVEDALRALGYKSKEIDRVVKQLDSAKDTSLLIKDALRLIAK